MQAIEIFKIGKHTATNGQTLPFDEAMLSAAVKGYDPSLHEAPVVIGHPKDNHPAFGWIDHLELTKDGVVLAHPKQVDAEFSDLVEQGKYKKRSASWYLPDSPNNPKPGTLYLRHVGFLGAMPPALKGLKDVSFNESEQGVVEFGDVSPWVFSSLAATLRRWREKMIAKEGIEEADKMIPSYEIDVFSEEAEKLRQERNKELEKAIPNFSENTKQDSTMTPEQIAALQAENADLKAKAVNFSESETAIKQRELALAKREIGLQVDDLVKQGKVLPAQKVGLVEFMASLDGETLTVEFGEGDKAQKVSPRQFMTDFLANQPKIIDFAEHSKGDGSQTPADLTAEELAKKASAYHAKQKAAGNEISFSEAMAVVQSGKDTQE
ncbi:MAG: peptidase [Agitococcus sp.]|nr:peptidase [Agitococcus sp.]